MAVISVLVLLDLPVKAQVTVDGLQVVQLYSSRRTAGVDSTKSAFAEGAKMTIVSWSKIFEARADIMKLPSYQFLLVICWPYGVCVKLNVERGWDLMASSCQSSRFT